MNEDQSAEERFKDLRRENTLLRAALRDVEHCLCVDADGELAVRDGKTLSNIFRAVVLILGSGRVPTGDCTPLDIAAMAVESSRENGQSVTMISTRILGDAIADATSGRVVYDRRMRLLAWVQGQTILRRDVLPAVVDGRFSALVSDNEAVEELLDALKGR